MIEIAVLFTFRNCKVKRGKSKYSKRIKEKMKFQVINGYYIYIKYNIIYILFRLTEITAYYATLSYV